jgi:acyl-CoA synthetase (AMP-forming)/AMP-acid ligase II
MPEIENSIPALLERRAQLQPDDVAYTFIDYEADPEGFAESLTWSELHQRVQVVAATLLKYGSPGDRAEPGVHRRLLRRDPGRVHCRAVDGADVRSAR